MAKAKTTQANPGYNELKAEIREGSCRSLYVLTGDEDFLIDRLISSLSELLIVPGCETLDHVTFQVGGQAGRLDPEKLKAEILTPPFLSRRKLIVVRQSGWFSATAGSRSGNESGSGTDDDRPSENPQSDADGAASVPDGEDAGSALPTQASAAQAPATAKSRQEFLTDLLGRLPDSACLVFVEQKVDKRLKSLIKAIEIAGVLSEIGKQPPRALLQWVNVECHRRGLAIDADAAQSMIDRCDSSMTVLWQEMSKLFLYCTYAGVTHVDLARVDELCLPDLRGSIFDLTDALSAGQTDRVLKLADTLISLKTPIQLISFMLTRHLRQLICAAESGRPDQIASELKVMPFIASRLAGQARKLPMPMLEDLYAKCFEMDLSVKSGRIGDRLALETLLVAASEQMRQIRQAKPKQR